MIWVDWLMPCDKTAHWRFNEACHLMSDGGVEELHAFAESIGLKRAWFQTSGSGIPHYDLSPNKRVQAIRAGAHEIKDRKTWAEVVRKARGHVVLEEPPETEG